MIQPSTMFDRPLQSWTSQQASLALQPVTPGRLGWRFYTQIGKGGEMTGSIFDAKRSRSDGKSTFDEPTVF